MQDGFLICTSSPCHAQLGVLLKAPTTQVPGAFQEGQKQPQFYIFTRIFHTGSSETLKMSVRLDSVAGSLGRGANGVADRRQLDVCRLHHPTSRFKAHKISHSHSIKRQRLCPLFASADHAPPVEEILDFKWEEPSTDGRLIIAPLAASEVGAASVVLTRAFATSPQGVPIEDGR